MSRVCHECGCNVDNPFYAISAVLRNNGKLFFSNLEVSLCETDFMKIFDCLHQSAKDLSTDLGFAIDGVTGACGGISGSVQISSGVYDSHGQHEFLNKEDGLQKLPVSAKDLLKNPCWMEKDENGDWKRVEETLMKESS